MTGPGQPVSDVLQKARQRLLRLGLTDDHILTHASPPHSSFDVSQLDVTHADPHFGPIVQRVLRFLRGGRGLSIAVTDDGERGNARVHTAVQLAAGLTRHGIQVVVVDMDFQRPGLQGLVPDTHAEGLIDMVRFGRSCRSVLQKPKDDGPSLLAAGSFPAQQPMPLDEDAVRSVLHRVSLHCELALYVTPLMPDGTTLNPAVRLCEHVVLVQSVSPATVDVVERIQLMQQARLHVAGVVLFEGEASATAAPMYRPGSLFDGPSAAATAAVAPAGVTPAPSAPTEVPGTPTPPAAPLEPAAGAAPSIPDAPPVTPEATPPAPPVVPEVSEADAGAEAPIPHIRWTGREPQPLTGDAPGNDDDIPEIHLPDEEPAAGPFSSAPEPFETAAAADPPAPHGDERFAPPVEEAPRIDGDAMATQGEQVIERLWSEPEPSDTPPAPTEPAFSLTEETPPHAQGADVFERAPEAADFGTTGFQDDEYEAAETEFAYDDGNNWSRTPLYILITLLVVVGGGFGWALWSKRGIEQKVGEQLADTQWIDEPSNPTGADTPNDAAAVPQDDAAMPPSGLGAVGDTSNDRGSSDQSSSTPQQPVTRPSTDPGSNAAAHTGGDDRGRSNNTPARTTPSGDRPSGNRNTESMQPVPVPQNAPGSQRPSTPSGGGGRSGDRPASPAAGAGAVDAANAAWTVHVGSFRHMEQAYEDIATLQKNGFTGRAVKTDLGDKGIWYRVYVGGFANRTEAEKVRDGILELPEYRYAQVKRLP